LKIYPPARPSLKELHEAARERDITVSFTPAGPAEGTVYTKNAVSWKGLRAAGLFGAKVPRPATAAERQTLVSELQRHGNLLAGLKKAVAISREHAGTLGFAIWEVAGILRAGPMKAYEQAKARQKPVRLIASRPSISRLMAPVPGLAAPSAEVVGVAAA